MARRLTPVAPEFVESAPLRLVFARDVTAPADAVFRALAEDVAAWPEWFSAITLARPVDGGTRRVVRLAGGLRFRETVLAAEPDTVYTYRIDETNAPGIRALVEEWRLTPSGAGTRVQWTFAADAPAPLRAALRLGRAGCARTFRTSVTQLERRLTASAG